MSLKKLKNAPLKEVIFELYWELGLDDTNFPFDAEFDLAQGRFATSISPDFPIHKRTIPAGANLKIYPRPIHQFWKGEIKWPVVQYGPGVLTVNDTNENYIWEDTYRPTILQTIKTLISSYKTVLSFNKVTLKYINSVDLPDLKTDINEFIRSNFQLNLINDFDQPGKIKGLNINQVYELDDNSTMNINIQTAINNASGKQACVWITSVEKEGTLSEEDALKWLDRTHAVTSDSFVKMLNPKFYAGLDC